MFYGIRVIQQDEAAAILNFHDRKSQGKPVNTQDERLGRFLVQEGDRWTAIDNTTGDAWTEDFAHRNIAEKWLNDDLETDEAHKLDDYINRIGVSLGEKINNWYRIAKEDYGVDGKFLCVEFAEDHLRILWEGDGTRMEAYIGDPTNYTIAQMYNIWMETEWSEVE